jgi:hypothetical protein
MRSLVAVAAVAASVVAGRRADLLKSHARGGRLYEDLLRRDAEEVASLQQRFPAWLGPNNVTFTKTSWIDNTNPAAGTFQQRFYYDLTACGSACATTAPVYLMVGGEWTVTASPSGALAELGLQNNAVMVRRWR